MEADNNYHLLTKEQEAVADEIRRVKIILEQLNPLPSETNTYTSVGKMFMKMDIKAIIANLTTFTERSEADSKAIAEKIVVTKKERDERQSDLINYLQKNGIPFQKIQVEK